MGSEGEDLNQRILASRIYLFLTNIDSIAEVLTIVSKELVNSFHSGAICSLILPITGIPALILLVMRKGEFQA